MNKVFKTAIALLFCLSLFFSETVMAATQKPDTTDISTLTPHQLKAYKRQQHKDSVRAKRPIWFNVLGGPSYTPEALLGVGGAMLATFSTNRKDSLLQRSFLPIGLNVSLNGTIVVAGAATLFFNQNKFRIYAKYGYRNEPANYYGCGYESIRQKHQSDSTTLYHRNSWQIFPRFVWEVKRNIYLGALFDINHSQALDINPVMAEDAYFKKYDPSYLSVGLGVMAQYDTRDDVATPGKGILLSGMYKNFGKYFGSKYNYQITEFEYRHFLPVFRPRSVLAWTAKAQWSWGDVPFSELPSFGSPNDLRGYSWGKYRDKSMNYVITEYRHMFGSPESYKQGNLWAKLGFVAWFGTASLGETPADWSHWKINYGAGLRIQIQPGKNFRLDVGKEPGIDGAAFYMNMTEAF